MGTNVHSIMMRMGNGHYKKASGEEVKGKTCYAESETATGSYRENDIISSWSS